jgi:aminoglycoside phosphotransferase (APT) family kinase protein
MYNRAFDGLPATGREKAQEVAKLEKLAAPSSPVEEKIGRWMHQEFGRNASVDHERDGLSNIAYRITCDGGEYILKTPNGIGKSRLGNEAGGLEVLEREGIETVPRKVFYGEPELLGQEVLVQTAVGGTESSIKKLDEKQRENFIQLLAEIHSIRPDAYNEVFESEEKASGRLMEDVRSTFEEHSVNRYEFYRKETDDFDTRVEEIFEEQKKLMDRIEDGEVDHRLVHGDLSRNMRVEEKKVFLYDWENCSIGIPRFELIFFFLHNDMDEVEREDFLDDYREYREIPEAAENAAEEYEKFLRINDMLWAAMMKEKALKAGKEPSKYSEMFERRVEKLYGEIL